MKSLLIVFFLLALIFSSCLVPVDSKNVSDRIMITDTDGNILGGKEDWCYEHNPTSAIVTQFKPAFPNPAQNDMVQINFEVANPAEVLIYIEPNTVIFSHSVIQGTYFFRVHGSELGFKDEVKIVRMKTSDGFECSGNIQF